MKFLHFYQMIKAQISPQMSAEGFATQDGAIWRKRSSFGTLIIQVFVDRIHRAEKDSLSISVAFGVKDLQLYPLTSFCSFVESPLQFGSSSLLVSREGVGVLARRLAERAPEGAYRFDRLNGVSFESALKKFSYDLPDIVFPVFQHMQTRKLALHFALTKNKLWPTPNLDSSVGVVLQGMYGDRTSSLRKLAGSLRNAKLFHRALSVFAQVRPKHAADLRRLEREIDFLSNLGPEQELLERGEALELDGDSQGAMALYIRAAEADIKNPFYPVRQAVLMFRKGNYVGAIEKVVSQLTAPGLYEALLCELAVGSFFRLADEKSARPFILRLDKMYEKEWGYAWNPGIEVLSNWQC